MLCGDPGVPIHGPSGASAHLRGVARGLAARGHAVVVAALRDSDARGRHDVPLGVPSVTLGYRRWPDGLRGLGERCAGRRLARRALRMGPFDLVWERYSLRCDAGVRLARRLGVPHLLEVNAPLSLDRGGGVALERRLLRATDRAVVVSGWLGRWARERGAREVRVVPNGSDLHPAQVARERSLTLVHHGSGRPWHGVDGLSAVLDALPDATLWGIGGAVPSHPRAVWLPTLDPPALAARLSRAHVALLPYPPDAPPWFDPLKLHDCRAVGLATVGSLHPAAAGADRRVALGDAEAWARAVRELASSRPPPRPRPWSQVCAEALAGLER